MFFTIEKIKVIIIGCCMLLPIIGFSQCPATDDAACSMVDMQYDNVVIGEVSGDAGQSDGTNDAIVEIVGPPGTNIGCMVITDTEWAVLIPPGTTIPADGVYSIGCVDGPGVGGDSGGVGLGGGATAPASPNGLFAGGNGDFNTGVPIDLNVCDPANYQYFDPAASGFTLDNAGGQGINGDGEQVFLFLPNGTPWDGFIWDGGGTGNADHVSVASGNAYTLGDNDGNGVVNDVVTTVLGGRGDGGNATAVPLLPTDAACPCNTPANPGTFTVPAYTPGNPNDLWVEWTTSDHVGCNSSFIKLTPGTSDGGFGGSPSHMDGEVLDATTDAMGQNLDAGSGSGVAGDFGETTITNEGFDPSSFTPSACDEAAALAEWAYTDHPTPGEPNDDPTFVFYASETVLCMPGSVTLTAEIYNWQHVEDATMSTNQGNGKTGSYVIDETGALVPWTVYGAPVGETTTLTYTSGVLAPGTYTFEVVWDDWTDCCGTTGTSTSNECYESEIFIITVAEPLTFDCDSDDTSDPTQTSCMISCDPGPPSAGTINAANYVTGGTGDYTYTLMDDSGTNPDESNNTGVFLLPTDMNAGPYTITIADNGDCGFPPLMITVANNCELPPVCPNNLVNTGTAPDAAVCPGDMVDLCLDGDDLPIGGSICWYGTTDGSNPIMIDPSTATATIGATAVELGCVEIPASNVPSGPPVLNEVHFDPVTNDGSGASGCEAIEIAGAPGTDVGCHILTDGDFTLVLPPGTVIPPNGFLVIGSSGCPASEYGGDVDVDISTCGCISNPNDWVMTNGGEYIAFFDDMGNPIDGVQWETPSAGNSPGTSEAVPTVAGCTTPATVNPSLVTYNTNINVSTSNGESIGLDMDETGGWVDHPSTPAMGDNSIGETNEAMPSPDCFTYTIPDLCAMSPATITIEPLIAPIDPNCVDGDFNYVGPTSTFTVDCPTADLTVAAFAECDDAGSTVSVDIPVTISGGTGPYTLVYSDGTSNTTLNGFTAGDVITIDGPTNGEIKISLVSITDEGGAQCEGAVDTDEVCVVISPIEEIQLSATVVDANSCMACDGQVTFQLASGTPAGNYEINYTVNGVPFSLPAAALPFTIMDACPGEYVITSATNDAGCDLNVTVGNSATVGGPSTPTLMATLLIGAVCDDPNFMMQSFDFTDDSVLDITADDGSGPYNDFTAITGAGGTLNFYSTDPTGLPPAAVTAATLNGTAIEPNTDASGNYVNTTVFVEYVDANGCTVIVPVTILVDANACGACPVIGMLADPADICVGEMFDLTASNLASMAMADNGDADFGIDFVEFGAGNPVPADPYTGGSSLGTVTFGALTGVDPTQSAMITGVGSTLTAGTYQICAILTPAPTDTDCRPSQCIEMVVNPNPVIAAVAGVCDDNGTTTVASDDTFTFTFDSDLDGSFDGTALGLTATEAVTGGVQYTSSAINIMSTMAGSPYTLTFTSDAGCTATVMIAVPATCSDEMPSISIDKDDADNTDDTQTWVVGESATFTIEVCNTGPEDLCNIVLSDTATDGALDVSTCVPTFASIDTDNGAVAAGTGDGMLLVGECESYTCTVDNVTMDFFNTASVMADGCTSGLPVDDTDPTKVDVLPCPDINISAVPFCSALDGTFGITITGLTGGDANGGGYTIAYSGGGNSGSIDYPTMTSINGLTYTTQNDKITLTVTDNDNPNCSTTYEVLQLNCVEEEVCDCDQALSFTINAQAASNGDGYSNLYVLQDAAGNIVAVNQTGTFTSLMGDGTMYSVIAINVIDADLTGLEAAITGNIGSPYADADYSGTFMCFTSSSAQSYSEDCGCGSFDLALTKVWNTTATPGPFSPGDLVTYTICVFNQGTGTVGTATNTEVTDYGSVTPGALIFSMFETFPTTTTMGNPVTITAGTGGTFTIDNLASGDDVCIDITYMISTNFMGTSILNNAEITMDSGDDEDSTEGDDEDSMSETDTDNELDDDSDGGMDDPLDEDDFDPAMIIVCPADCGDASTFWDGNGDGIDQGDPCANPGADCGAGGGICVITGDSDFCYGNDIAFDASTSSAFVVICPVDMTSTFTANIAGSIPASEIGFDLFYIYEGDANSGGTLIKTLGDDESDFSGCTVTTTAAGACLYIYAETGGFASCEDATPGAAPISVSCGSDPGGGGSDLVSLAICGILADPDQIDGDADGMVNSCDEFIQICNTGTMTVDLSGFEISDATSVRHIFPGGSTLAAGACLTLYSSDLNATTCGSGVWNNGGDTATISDSAGMAITSVTYTASADDEVINFCSTRAAGMTNQDDSK